MFTPEAHGTWGKILRGHAAHRDQQICDLFLKGVGLLGLEPERIPRLEDVNAVLQRHSGFKGVFVGGLEDGASFFRMLSRREFPIGNFIRDAKDLGYTPAPDVVHDLYGHLPFFTDREYADYCQAFGATASIYADRPEILRQYERFFWFTIEFGMLQTPQGLRVFGAGIASSTAECDYALGGTPEIRDFDVDVIRRQEFRIDEMQPILFRIQSTEQLYGSLRTLRDHALKETS